jgi:hypothetical protein
LEARNCLAALAKICPDGVNTVKVALSSSDSLNFKIAIIEEFASLKSFNTSTIVKNVKFF